MSKTLVEQLRDIEDDDSYCGVDIDRTGTCNASHLLEEAADRIEELQRKHTELLDGLEAAADALDKCAVRTGLANSMAMTQKAKELRALIEKVKADD